MSNNNAQFVRACDGSAAVTTGGRLGRQPRSSNCPDTAMLCPLPLEATTPLREATCAGGWPSPRRAVLRLPPPLLRCRWLCRFARLTLAGACKRELDPAQLLTAGGNHWQAEAVGGSRAPGRVGARGAKSTRIGLYGGIERDWGETGWAGACRWPSRALPNAASLPLVAAADHSTKEP